MNYRALIPVKMLHEAKSRLANHLNKDERATLVLTMLHHVIQILHETQAFERIVVVSADSLVLEQARKWGASPAREQQQGHNPALRAAALQEMETGAHALLTISADLPLLQRQDIKNMLEQAHLYDVVLASSSDGTGTNALLVHPPLAVPYVFGPGSLQHFQSEARERQLLYTLYTSIRSGLDIDTIEDLDVLRQYSIGHQFPYTSFLSGHLQ